MSLSPSGNFSIIGSSSSFSSSKSSLLTLPTDEASSQSDVADLDSQSMPRGDISAYEIAESPNHAATKASLSSGQTASATQKIRRVFKRRRPSQDSAGILSAMLSADEQWRSDPHPLASSSNQLSRPAAIRSTSSRPSAAKLTMNLFSRKNSSPDPQPPPLPPKPSRPPPPAIQLNTTSKLPRPRSSVMVASPSINPAIEFMRDTEAKQQHLTEGDVARARMEVSVSQASPESKEKWRRSDSTMDSGHTVRPTNLPESGTGNKRVSAYLASPTSDGDIDLLEFLAGAPVPDKQRSERHVEAPMGKQSKRRSLSLNIHVPLSHTSSPASTHYIPPNPAPLSTTDLTSVRGPYNQVYSHTHTASRTENPAITRTPASGQTSPTTKTNIRNRLNAWTSAAGGNRTPSPSPSPIALASTSSPSLLPGSNVSLQIVKPRRTPVASNASQGELHAINAVRHIQSRVRSPSNSSISNGAGIKQAATTLTSGAGAIAYGLGKRAYERVNRVLGSQSNTSGSGSDTPSHRHPSPVLIPSPSGANNAHGPHNNHFGPSSFPRRTPNASSGTWSIPSQTGSRSSSEKDPSGRDTPASTSGSSGSGALGRLIRPPPRNNGVTSGIVFGRELWECVKDTRAPVTPSPLDPLSGRMIPALVYRCVQHLHRWGLEEEGLFRISGRSSHITRLKTQFDAGADYNIIDCSPSELDPHAVASVFKAYLRELPEPILTKALASLFDNAITAENSRAIPTGVTGALAKTVGQNGPSLPSSPTGPRPMPIPMLRKPPSLSTFTLPTSSSLRAPSNTLIETLGDLISRLPRENHDLLLTVVELIKATAARSKETKMPLSNLLLVFCPSLHMVPTLLRAFCDVPDIWERTSEVLDNSKVHVEEDDVESTNSDSSSDIEYEDQDLVPLPSSLKGKGREIIDEDRHTDIPNDSSTEKAATAPETIALSADDDVILIQSSRKPREPRRLPDPPVRIRDRQAHSSSASSSRPSTPPLPAAALSTHSDSTSSIDISSPGRSRSSPLASEISLTSSENKAPAKSQTNTSFGTTLPSSAHVPSAAWSATNYSKALPANPADYAQQQLNVLEALTRASRSRAPGDYSGSAPHLLGPLNSYSERSGSLPTPLAMASQSAPSVVFPTVNTAPSTPTSLKKHTLTLSLGRHPKLPGDEDGPLPSPSKRVVRRPSLNLLFNMKRGGSPSPRSRTPTISSPLQCSPMMMHIDEDCIEELSRRTVTDPSPPVLSLPMESGMAGGWNWDDVFGGYSIQETATPSPSQHRQTAVSQPSAQPPPLSSINPSPLASRRPTTEYLLSSGGFFSTSGPPTVLPSAISVLEAAENRDIAAGVRPSGSGSASAPPSSPVGTPQEDNSSGDDSPPLSSPKEPLSPPPLINFPLCSSSFDEEDWANAVLMAAGKPTDLFA
ncbi:hypothetical protein BU17DRAFT_95615 [Hysterangium stoloniferum]|nr:hypothetical protein BU17DRAFT_95615 [Hysterangium stoloniferum]